MRLICPNCGAQYEVADDVIPEAGRDVQCSNCGHTWFENPGASEAAELGTEPEPAPEPAPEIEPEPEQATEPEPQPEPTPEPDRPEPAPRARELDPGVADILREEAEYEQAARQAEDNPIETQPDLDLSHDPEPQETETVDPDEDRRSREARDRLAKLRGEPEIAAAVGATMAQDRDAPRRELLPDIEEINSSLRPDAANTYADVQDDMPKQRSGFRRGFVLMVILAIIALAAYVFSPQISAAVPQIEPALTSYVTWVDGMRIWLDQQLQGLIATETPDAADG